MKPHVLILGAPPPPLLARLGDAVTHRIVTDAASIGEDHSARAAISVSGLAVDDALLVRMPALELVSKLGVGYDNIDVIAARARGVVVTHTRDVLNADVANFALALLLAGSRAVVSEDAYVRAGRWGREPMPPLRWSVEGKTIGILGLGRIGRTLAAKLQAFGCEILYHGRRAQPDQPYEYCADLAAMARRAKALILTCPGGAETAGLVTREVIEALGPDGFLINVARGEVVDQEALIAALQDGRLGQAALDVFADEPDVPDALRAMPNVILTPHVASATVETRGAMFELCADNVLSWFARGRALTPVPEHEGWAPA